VTPNTQATALLTPRMLSVKQAAAYTGATVWAIRQLYWKKEVAAFKAGRRLLIERTSLDAWIDRRLRERASGQINKRVF
jgi:excisionase family DNA binding protein